MSLLEEAKFWPYRFKTREEFEEQYGEEWRFHNILTAFVDEMDYLLGKPLESDFPDSVGFEDDEEEEITIPRRDEDIEYGEDDEEDDNVWFIKRSFLKKNDEIRIPNYTPRKITRTLEARNSYKDANEIYMVVENKEELAIVKDKVYDLYGYIWLNTLDDYLTDGPISFSNPYPIYIFINLKSRTFGYALRDNMNSFTDITQHHIFDGVLNKLFTIVDINRIVKMMKTGEIMNEIPNYNPRRITRTLEKRNSVQEAEEVSILIRNVEEYDKFYDAIIKLGYVISEPFYKANRKIESPINIFVHLKTGMISLGNNIHDYDRHWTDYSSFDGVWEKELTIDELPYIIDILKHGKIIPSYRPKKIIRKLDEEINFDILKFLPSKPQILTPEEQKIRYKIGDIVIVRPDAFNFFNDRVDEMENFLGKEVRIIEVNTAIDKYGDDEKCERRNLRPNDLMLTVEKSGNYFGDGHWYWSYKCLVNPTFIVPSYKPRKINRTLDDLNESPDWATFIDNNDKVEILKWDLPGAFAFGYYKDKMYLSPETKGHGSMGSEDDRRIKMFDRNDFTFSGRFWKNQKLISFWVYPKKEEFKKILFDLSEITNINFNKEWKVEIIDNGNQPKNIPIDEYEGSEQRTSYELATQHIKSPLLKHKIIPQGWGSTHPRYSSNRKWQMASMSDESVLYENKWLDEFKRRQEVIMNGPYDVVFISAPTIEDKIKLKKFLIRIQIVGSLEDLDNEKMQDFFIVFKKGVLQTFRIDGFDEPDTIREHFTKHLPGFDRLSPTFTVDRFIWFISPFIQEARNMYQPRKINRTLESNTNKYPYEYIIIKVESRKDIDIINNELSTISPELCNEYDFEFEYPNVMLIRPQKSNDGNYQSMQVWSYHNDIGGLMTYMNNERNLVDPYIYSMNELKNIKMLIQYGIMIPSYRPRRIDRTI